ncbi:MAG: hypothetical protein JSU75_12610 [Gammaproteobacteria bacterium]|nr:MAG: hypothetical protein JSU75_12610 [Gammaproteobacteria bacterium]
MKRHSLTATALAAGMVMFAGGAVAHEPGALAGTPVCTESNLMAADAQNFPFANTGVNAAAGSPGRVLEMNITTGERGITVNRPFAPEYLNTPICDNGGVTCDLGVGPFGDGSAPWKPTGVLSGGENGHAFITSAAQHAITEFHRNGTPIRTAPTLPTSPSPNGGGFGWVPRLLGSGFMPNGNVAQAVCDANFFNASNSDPMGPGESGKNYNAPPGVDVVASNNSSYLYFPPVYSTPERGGNGRILVYDQTTLEVIDEYNKPTTGPYANDPRWTCPAGVIFTSEGMYVSFFHGDAVFVVDWKAGIDPQSYGTGANKPGNFVLGKEHNEAKVLRVIDLSNCGEDGCPGDALEYDDSDTGYDSPNRRDNLRAIRMSEDGTLWGTRRSRSRECLRGEAPMADVPDPSGNPPCNPSVFRQHIFAAGPGEDHRTGSIALDPGVNVIAGVTINRMSGPGCAYVQAEVLANGGTLTGDECDVETLYAGASAANPGCDPDGDGNPGPGHPANQCFRPGGAILEYRIDAAHMDGGNGKPCTGDPADGFDTGEGNEGCALPIAVFEFVAQGDGTDEDTSGLPDGVVETIDPRMVMTIHEAFVQ